jgi:CheY-like chemotaxis protein
VDFKEREMPQSVIWLDNDPGWLTPYVESLESSGFVVKIITSVLEAEHEVSAGNYNILILDVMIPTMSPEEEELYPPLVTKMGCQTGLIFFKRMKDTLAANNTQVLVVTVRLDKTIVDEFVKAGLPRERLQTRLALREAPVFVRVVKSVLPS